MVSGLEFPRMNELESRGMCESIHRTENLMEKAEVGSNGMSADEIGSVFQNMALSKKKCISCLGIQ